MTLEGGLAWLVVENMGFDKANLGSGRSPAPHEVCDLGQVTLLSLGVLPLKSRSEHRPLSLGGRED